MDAVERPPFRICDEYSLCYCHTGWDGHCMYCCLPAHTHKVELLKSFLEWATQIGMTHPGLKYVTEAITYKE